MFLVRENGRGGGRRRDFYDRAPGVCGERRVKARSEGGNPPILALKTAKHSRTLGESLPFSS